MSTRRSSGSGTGKPRADPIETCVGRRMSKGDPHRRKDRHGYRHFAGIHDFQRCRLLLIIAENGRR